MKLTTGVPEQAPTTTPLPVPTLECAIEEKDGKQLLTLQAVCDITDAPYDVDVKGKRGENKGKVVATKHKIAEGLSIPLFINGQSVLDDAKNQVYAWVRVSSQTTIA